MFGAQGCIEPSVALKLRRPELERADILGDVAPGFVGHGAGDVGLDREASHDFGAE